MFFKIKDKNDSKMAIKYKIKLRDLKLEHLKEYIAPIFNFLKPKNKITNISELRNFIQRKSAWVSQETLYGYLKTRMGAKYILMFEDEIFLGSINKAKWNIFAVALQDLTFYCLSYLKNNSNTDYTLNAIEIYKEILNEEKNNQMPDDIIENSIKKLISNKKTAQKIEDDLAKKRAKKNKSTSGNFAKMKGKLNWPSSGIVISEFGMQTNPVLNTTIENFIHLVT